MRGWVGLGGESSAVDEPLLESDSEGWVKLLRHLVLCVKSKIFIHLLTRVFSCLPGPIMDDFRLLGF